MPVSDGIHALVVGEALVDITRGDGPCETVRPGGSPLNVAVGMSRLEVATVLGAQVGDDAYGELLREHLDSCDVDLRSLPPHHPDTSTALARLDPLGVATYQFDLGWDPSELPPLEGFDVVHVGSIAAALAPGADAVARLVAGAHARGVAVSVDPNVRPAITPDVADVRVRLTSILDLARVCKLSDEDAEALFPGSTPAQAADHVLASGRANLVAVTLGDQGALLASGTTRVQVPATATGSVVDTIGAGDAFMAALLAALTHRGWLGRESFDETDLVWLGTTAGTAAGITCSREGADPPYIHELPCLATYTRSGRPRSREEM